MAFGLIHDKAFYLSPTLYKKLHGAPKSCKGAPKKEATFFWKVIFCMGATVVALGPGKVRVHFLNLCNSAVIFYYISFINFI